MSLIDANTMALIVALLINVPTWYMLRESKKKAANEAATLEEEITDRVLKRAHDENSRLEERLTKCENDLEAERGLRRQADKKAAAYLTGIYLLSDQLISNDLIPCWKPEQTGPLVEKK